MQICAQYNITAIAFLSKFGGPSDLVPNLANHNSSTVEAAITACQSYGAKILLSLGGHGGMLLHHDSCSSWGIFGSPCRAVDFFDLLAHSVTSHVQLKHQQLVLYMAELFVVVAAGDSCTYGFSSEEDAAKTALNIWQLFLGGYPNKPTTKRPFGNAVLDGIDLDIECAAKGTDPAHYVTFVQQLRALMSNSSTPDAATAALGTASYLITAAPQCIFPDAYQGPETEGLVLTNSAMQIDYVWPQFYNNPSCQFNSTDEGAGFQQSFQTWSSWAASAAPSLEMLVGLPASSSAAGTGFMAVDDEEEQIKLIRAGNATNFDGVMLWSAAWESANAQMNQSYLPTVLASLTGTAFTSCLHLSFSCLCVCTHLLALESICEQQCYWQAHVCLRRCFSKQCLTETAPARSATACSINYSSSAADPVHSGAEAQQVLRSVSFVMMAVGLLICLL